MLTWPLSYKRPLKRWQVLRYIARYFRLHLWLGLAATAYAALGWGIIGIPLSSSPVAFAIKLGLTFSAPVNLIVVPLAYALLERLPARATVLRYLGIVSAFGWPYICVYVLRWVDAAALLNALRGDPFVAEILIVPLMGFSALAGLSCAMLFNRFGGIREAADVAAALRSTPKED
jgi:hypothetical protein